MCDSAKQLLMRSEQDRIRNTLDDLVCPRKTEQTQLSSLVQEASQFESLGDLRMAS